MKTKYEIFIDKLKNNKFFIVVFLICTSLLFLKEMTSFYLEVYESRKSNEETINSIPNYEESLNTKDYYSIDNFELLVEGFKAEFHENVPEILYLYSYKCLDYDCKHQKRIFPKIYLGDTNKCLQLKEYEKGKECLNKMEKNGNKIFIDSYSIGNVNTFEFSIGITNEKQSKNYGYLHYLRPNNDAYITKAVKQNGVSCDATICINPDKNELSFNRINFAPATIQGLEAKNIKSSFFPITIYDQTEVKGKICNSLSLNHNLYTPKEVQESMTLNGNAKLEIKNIEKNNVIYTAIKEFKIYNQKCITWPNEQLSFTENGKYLFSTEISINEKYVQNFKDRVELTQYVYE